MDVLMTIWVFFIGIIIGIVIGVGLSHRNAVTPLQRKLDKASSQIKEYPEVMKYYPFNQENFRFIGSPIEGIQFEDDQILFILFKKEYVPLTFEQDHIKTLLQNGKVRWFEFMTS